MIVLCLLICCLCAVHWALRAKLATITFVSCHFLWHNHLACNCSELIRWQMTAFTFYFSPGTNYKCNQILTQNVLHTWTWNNCSLVLQSLGEYDSSSLVRLQHIKHTHRWGGVTSGKSAIVINISEYYHNDNEACTVRTYFTLLTLPLWSLTTTVMETWYNWLKDHLIAWMWHWFPQPTWYRRSFSHFSQVDVLAHWQQNHERLIPASLTGTLQELMWHVNDWFL